ncbi:hypothetical protein VTO42DRAFT_3893 [Malbranchea cinnamomea]
MGCRVSCPSSEEQVHQTKAAFKAARRTMKEAACRLYKDLHMWCLDVSSWPFGQRRTRVGINVNNGIQATHNIPQYTGHRKSM